MNLVYKDHPTVQPSKINCTATVQEKNNRKHKKNVGINRAAAALESEENAYTQRRHRMDNITA